MSIKRRSRSPTNKEGDETAPLKEAGPLKVAAPYPKLSDLPPVGQSLWPVVWDRDPASELKKKAYVLLLILSTAYMLKPDVLLYVLPEGFIDLEWDIRNNITDFSVLMQVTLGLKAATVQTLFWWTFGFVALLTTADVLLGFQHSKLADNSNPTFPWPTSWKTENTICYHDMFSEPTRHGRLLRRPGNTLSNFNYVLTSLAVLTSCWGGDRPNPYVVSDVQYGVCVLVLAITSVLWHGSNAPWSQYPDLGSMFCSILYLVVRYACQALVLVLVQHGRHWTVDSAQSLASTICCLAYTGVCIAFGHFYWTQFQKGWLHGGSPDSVRTRLLGTSNIFGHGHQDVNVGTVCAFTALPFFILLPPTLGNLFLFGSCGSRQAANYFFRSLMVGWGYRTWERFVLDGHAGMNYFLAQPTSMARTIGCAILSPTAQHHVWTGMTLLVGYLQLRSLDGVGLDQA